MADKEDDNDDISSNKSSNSTTSNGWSNDSKLPQGARPKVKNCFNQNGLMQPTNNANSVPNQDSVNDSLDSKTDNGSVVNGAPPVNGRNASSTSESDDDECCIYTYKGDGHDGQFADLPSSFYKLDFMNGDNEQGFFTPRVQPAPQRNPIPNGVFSPDMDFLEMDFDPSATEGEPDSDSSSIDDGNQIELNNDLLPIASNLPKDTSVMATVTKLPNSNMNASSEFVRTSNNVAGCSSAPDLSPNKPSTSASIVHSFSFLSQPIQNQGLSLKTWPVKDRPLESDYTPHVSNMPSYISPKLEEYNLQTALLQSLKTARQQAAAVKPIQLNSVTVHPYNCRQESSCNNPVEKVMIWSEHEAFERQVSQVGPSGCGATSIVNVLRAMQWPSSVAEVQQEVKTRLRADAVPVPEYLFSRSVAGVNHLDMLEGIERLSHGAIIGRFFHMYPQRNFNLSQWLAHWIRKGAIPVTTLNLQRHPFPDGSLPDAWHHQMIFGVDDQGIYLTNPSEKFPQNTLMYLLCSPSVLMIRRLDVVNRWSEICDLTPLMNHSDHRWKQMNVLGQVVNMLREEFTPEVPGFRPLITDYISIPACYKSGITLFLRKDAPASEDLLKEPELPLLPMCGLPGSSTDFV